MSAGYIILAICVVAVVIYLINDVLVDRGEPSLGDLFRPLVRAMRRVWLQHNINGWQRDIKGIHAQRENDLRAERAINREIINARSELLDL